MITPKTDRAEENVFSRYSDPSIIIKDYPQEKLFAVLNVNRKPFSEGDQYRRFRLGDKSVESLASA